MSNNLKKEFGNGNIITVHGASISHKQKFS